MALRYRSRSRTPLPGSCRPGWSAICTWAIRRLVLGQHGVQVLAVVREVEEVAEEADLGRTGGPDPLDHRGDVGRGPQRVGLGAADRLDQDGGPDPRRGPGGLDQVLGAHLVLLLRGDAVHPVAVERVERRHAQPLADADGDRDVVAELLRAGRDGQHPAVGTGQVAGEEVESDEADARVADRGDERVDLTVGGDGLLGPRPPELDGLETSGPGGGGPLQQGHLREQQRAVGGVAEAVHTRSVL